MQRLTPVLREDGVDLELILLLRTILAASKEICFRVRQGALSGVLGSTLDENIQGETQKKLDVLSNQLLKDMLLDNASVRAIASEEEDTPVAGRPGAPYVVAFDPLDGSSNIDVNGCIGTIFTIYPSRDDVPDFADEQFLQGGRKQVAAGYVLYGPSALLVLTTGGPTRCFTLDATHGGFLLTQDALEIPSKTSDYSINSARQYFWSEGIQNYINDLNLGLNGPRKQQFNMRWAGAMVGDVHRVLTQGGVFIYPSLFDNGNKKDKLRLLYEANPLAMLMENAGGKAVTSQQNILDLAPQTLHQRTDVYMGSADEVEVIQGYL